MAWFSWDEHAQFSSPLASLVYGKRSSDGAFIHISAAGSGLQADLVCPVAKCGKKLIAKKGLTGRAHHFAHYADNVPCTGSAETMAHAFAKDVLGAKLRLWLPSITGEHQGKKLTTRAAKWQKFEAARLEHRLDDIVPDVILEVQGRELLVEVRVTHACGPDKIRKLRTARLPTLEIDLRKFRNASVPDLVEAILKTAPRAWLFNEHVEGARERLVAEAKLAREREARAATETAANILSIPTLGGPHPTADAAARFVERIGKADRIGLPVRCERAFARPLRGWQALLFKHFLVGKASTSWGWNDSFHPTEAVKWLAAQGHIHSHFVRDYPAPLLRALRSQFPGFQTPNEAVEQYLEQLAELDELREDTGSWSLPDAARSNLKSASQKTEAEDRRLTDGERRVAAVVGKLPAEDQAGFDIRVWASRPLTGFGRSFYDLARQGGSSWSRLDDALRDLESIFVADNRHPQFLLDLPFENEVQRSLERQRVREEARLARLAAAAAEAAAERLANVRGQAAMVMGTAQAEVWFSTLVREGDTELSMSSLVSASDEGERKALSALSKIKRDIEQTAKREEAARQAREQLRHAALGAFQGDEARADLFVRASHPSLGKSPLDYCVDQWSLTNCLSLLPGARPSRRRA